MVFSYHLLGLATASAFVLQAPLRRVHVPQATKEVSEASEVIETVMTNVRARPVMTEEVMETLETFLETYIEVVEDLGRPADSVVPVVLEYVDLVEQQLTEPFAFKPLHSGQDSYYEMDTNFMEPLIDMEDSVLLGAENVEKIKEQLANGENVVLLSNHQTEADPSAWSALFDRGSEEWRDTEFAKKMIMVAGDRVTTDPVAVPFSKARNLLCIYSKRHIDKPPEMKRKKQLHNTKTMGAMLKLLAEGGNMIWVAPSGGRDRPNDDGDFAEPAVFDAKSVDMFRLMASKVSLMKKTHFWPTAMLTYRLFPPPPKVNSGNIGEPRIALRGSVNAAFGPELDFSQFESGDREKPAAYAYEECRKAYEALLKEAAERGSPYYSPEARRDNAKKVLEQQQEYEKLAADSQEE